MKILDYKICFKCDYFRSRATAPPTCDCRDLSTCIIRKNNEKNCSNCIYGEPKSYKGIDRPLIACEIRRGDKCGDREFKYPYHVAPEFIKSKEMKL